ncbi:GNAT family N-acetyltransferase [Streptosporangium sp. NPDC023963]|uniref:GNAT family N-acetyltransferase n=1 Tax=Streptosporangium sp. NPDC023963 TaxID=3155608 RepID=UPI0034232474
MILKTVAGLPLAVVDVQEALGGEWRRHRHQVDVVRVQNPPAEHWTELAAAGFLPKPQVVVWRAATAGSEEEFLNGLNSRDRRNVFAARRRGLAAGLRFEVRPVSPKLLEEFLPLYESQVTAMRHGWLLAVQQRERILAEGERYFALCAWDGETLAGACLNLQSRDKDEVRARFSAVAPRYHATGLARLLYMEVIEEARRREFTWVSLGSDPNLYGHLTKPGLFGFKSRLGFVALPSHLVDPASGSDQADRIVNLGALTDPSFVLAYAVGPDGRPERGAALRLEMFSFAEELDLRPYSPAYLTGVRLHHLHRPLLDTTR